jgi:hypothetical protein
MDDAKQLKTVILAVDKLISVLNSKICGLQQLKMKSYAKLSQKIDSVKTILEEAEKKFMIQYAVDTETADNKPIEINMGNEITFECFLYKNKKNMASNKKKEELIFLCLNSNRN